MLEAWNTEQTINPYLAGKGGIGENFFNERIFSNCRIKINRVVFRLAPTYLSKKRI